MTKSPSMLKTLLIASYALVFMAGLGAFCSTMGCKIDKSCPKAIKKEASKTHLRMVNPMQALSSKFF